MSFWENIKNSIKILGFNEDALIKTSNNDKATGYGFLTLAIAGVAVAISILNPVALIIGPIVMILVLFGSYSIYHFIAKYLLGGKATGTQYFRALSNAFVIYWFTFIPLVGVFLQYIAGLWLMIINMFILHKVHKLSMAKAIILGLLPFIIALLVVIGAIAYFGVLNPSALLPVK